MSLLSMPFLIVNFGGEMIYILEQRLHAQNIPKDKSNKVLQDVTRAMFSIKFVAELVKPQEIYSSASTREIFDRLAHSSIMRLSESSMDKLYDLMTMGFKYQLVSCTHPRELVEVTLNHLDSIRSAVEASSSTVEQVDYAIALLSKLCKEISSAEFAQIRQSLAAFFQDKRIKVSLFLQDAIQNPDGSIVIPKGGPLANDESVELPGSIKYFDDSGAVTGTESFDYPLAGAVTENLMGDAYDGQSRDSKLGKNLYTVDRTKKKEAAKTTKPNSTVTATTTSAQKMKESGGTAQAELKALSDMLAPAAPVGSFKIKLFPDAGEDAGAATREISISKISREEMEKTNKELVGVIESMNIGESSSGEKDMLELMDDASK
eukprot:NODE_724_length_1391_cov_56.061848_g533_i0.p1 GENE.NODE_724_length_1391_cov_56.061848_g533_i0~~NODE_724_length_1391_cov_56.061848_g533_i0.p1  ORF type:complete len:376 (-),score=102.16 NODE_724_length_1391_cov_56.061848_g533_i0:173-1300(-)